MAAIKTTFMLLGILTTGYLSDAYKILVVFPLPGKSHSLLGEGVVRHLLNAGHEVTYITPFLMADNIPNLHQVDLTDNMGLFPHNSTMGGIMNKKVQINDHRLVMNITANINKKTLEHPNVQKLMYDANQTFDAVIVEWMFGEVLAGLSAVYDAPLIWLSSIEPHWLILDLIDEIPNPAYNSDILSENTPPLTFKERVEELWTMIKVSYFKIAKLLLNHTDYFKKLMVNMFHFKIHVNDGFGVLEVVKTMLCVWWEQRDVVTYELLKPGETGKIQCYANSYEEEQYNSLVVPAILKRRTRVPSLQQMRYSGSLVLGNTHVSVGEAIRLPQNYKHVGGYHIEEKVKPLPENLKRIMDEAKNGVIYFSMGSNLNSKDMPEEMKRNLIKMFGTLKETIIWKFEEELPDRPKNVHILKWAPQPSILAHPNCMLFITHGGLLSTTETVHFGVPIIGIPVFADQFINVIRSVRRGIGLRVDLSNTMADELKLAIEEVIGNPKYAQRVKQLSAIFHDRPMKPGAELVYWVEHVVRTNGAPHLKSPALMLPWYQKAYLDLVAILLCTLIVIVAIVKTILCLVFSKKKTEDGIKKKN